MERVLITGASGFIGRHFAASQADKFKMIIPPKQFDVSDWKQVNALPDADAVLNLAAISSIPACKQSPRECFAINAGGTVNMLEYCRSRGSRLVQASSVSVYGKPKHLPVSETHERNPITLLGQSKAAAEIACEAYAVEFGLPVTAVRMFSVYGPGQNAGYMISSFIRQALEEKRVSFEHGERKRDLLYIDDAVPALANALLLKKKGFEAVNLGSGESVSVSRVAELVALECGVSNLSESEKSKREGEVDEIRADNSKAKKLLALKVRTNIEEGVRKTVRANA
ncbi:MAG: NAD-dependent epimerase/dehydratase family protein [Candidatus Micrarchaeota archaeon]